MVLDVASRRRAAMTHWLERLAETTRSTCPGHGESADRWYDRGAASSALTGGGQGGLAVHQAKRRGELPRCPPARVDPLLGIERTAADRDGIGRAGDAQGAGPSALQADGAGRAEVERLRLPGPLTILPAVVSSGTGAVPVSIAAASRESGGIHRLGGEPSMRWGVA